MITASDLFIKYGDRTLLDKISFTIRDRDKVGLVGRNGAGKSTLLKVIAKEQNVDSGTLARPAGTTLGFLHQEMSMPKGKTVMEEALTAFDEIKKIDNRIEAINVDLGVRTDYESDAYTDLLQELSDANERFILLGGATMEADTQKVLQGLGFKVSDFHRLTDEFSGGWQMRIELTKMLLQRPDFLLLDEPTNHLDIESILWLEDFLKNYEGAVIVISHDKLFLDNVTKRTIEVELGKLYDYKANYSNYLALRAERREKMESAFKNQQRAIAQREKTINRFMAKATKTKMAQSMKKQLDKVERIELSAEDTASMNIRFHPAPRSGEIVVGTKNVTKSYGDLNVLNEVAIEIERGQRVAFVGQNGQGKTTLSKILIGKEPASSGSIDLGHNVKIGYYAQNQSDTLHQNVTLLETMEDHAPPEMRTKLRGILGAFMFSGEDVEKKVSVLSGGERARLALACMLLKPFNLLVLDEPTNHLDIISKEVLKSALLDYDGTLLVVSHDRDFLQGLTDRTVEFRDGQIYNHIGDVNAFLEKRKADNMRQIEMRKEEKKKASATPSLSKAKSELSNEERKELNSSKKKLQRQVQQEERKIDRLEEQSAKLEKEMGVDGFYESADAQKTLDKYNGTKVELEVVMEAWEKAQEQYDAFVEQYGDF